MHIQDIGFDRSELEPSSSLSYLHTNLDNSELAITTAKNDTAKRTKTSVNSSMIEVSPCILVELSEKGHGLPRLQHETTPSYENLPDDILTTLHRDPSTTQVNKRQQQLNSDIV